MRSALAAAAVLLVLLTAVAPHVHEGVLGRHACVACVTAGGEESASETPDVAPRALVSSPVPELLHALSAAGFPLGAVSGQSPPRA